MDKDFDGIVDLYNYSIEDSCLWLLTKLDIAGAITHPYTRPFCNYVMSWRNAIPLNAIVIAQSPYPNPIFPEIAAAMSYDIEKCRKVMKTDMPPTAAILSNDLKIHADMKKEDTISTVMNGWMLAPKGILLVNSSVFKPYGTAAAYDECMNQVNVLYRMLIETEKFGERTVDIIAYGAGQAMASELTKCFKSDIVKLTKFTSSHPASLSYRMNDFNSPDCHMDAPSTSRALAKHFSNHVAYVYTMAKKSESEIKAQRQLDIIRSLGEQLSPLKEVSDDLFPMMRNLLKALDEEDVDTFKTALQQIIHTGDTFTFRLGTASAALIQAQSTTGGTGSTVSKPGPSFSTTSPSAASLSQHVGGEFKSVNPMPPRRINLGKSRTVPKDMDQASVSDNTVNLSSPPSVMSEATTTTGASTSQQQPVPRSKPIKLRKSSAPTTGTPGTQPHNVEPPPEPQTPKATPQQENEEDDKTTSSLGARFRKLTTIPESSHSGNIGKEEKKGVPNPDWALSKEVLNQLSCIEVVVQAHAPEKAESDEFQELMEALQSDMQSKTAYNLMTQRLIEAIKTDQLTNPKFDFSDWAAGSKKPSATFDQCREEFEF